MTAEIIRVTDRDSRAKITEDISKVNARAKRVPHVVHAGTDLPPTEWDRRHQQINLLLDELEVGR